MEGQREELWDHLPEELQLKVMEDHLPLRSQCRLRSVSRAWKTPRLKREALSGLYVCRDNSSRKSFFLYDRNKEKSHLLYTGSLKRSFCLVGCVNGVAATVFSKTRTTFPSPATIKVLNVFSPRPRWAKLPRPPRAPKRACIFAGIMKRPRDHEPPRIGVTKLDDFIFLAAMGDPRMLKNLLLQVYKDGVWSSSLMEFPAAHQLLYNDIGMIFRCGEVRGSLFYFFTSHSDLSSASLCCVDVLSDDKRCQVVCGLDDGLVTTDEDPKLAVCSGRILLVQSHVVNEGKSSIRVWLLEDEESKPRWRLASSLPLEDPGLLIVRSGGEELIVYPSDGFGYIYNFITGTWGKTTESLTPLCYQE